MNSYSLGNVTSNGSATGGLVGYNTGLVSNSYAMGSVTNSSGEKILVD